MGKRKVRNILILILPFLIMVVINETVRLTTTEKGYSRRGITAINSAKQEVDNCSWNCHNNSNYCINNHISPYFKEYLPYTDVIYFGVIRSLKNTGNYHLANLVFLVVLIPFLIWILLVKSWNTQDQINQIKNTKR